MEFINKIAKIYLNSDEEDENKDEQEHTYGYVISQKLDKNNVLFKGDVPNYYVIEPIKYIPKFGNIDKFLDFRYVVFTGHYIKHKTIKNKDAYE